MPGLLGWKAECGWLLDFSWKEDQGDFGEVAGAVRRELPGAFEGNSAPYTAPGVDSEEPVSAFLELGGEGIHDETNYQIRL